jgi:phenylalanyl-tRNA synthetase beta chain
MLFSWNWISDHVDTAGIDPVEAAAKLTAVGLAVEQVEPRGDDTVFDVDITTNRPDAMNHRGIARELAAIYGRELRPLSHRLPAPSAEGPERLVTIEDPDLCPRYFARLVTGVKVAPSPAWLAARLEAIGSRPINNVVDATNFVLWGLGHPLHAFDRDLLAEGRIVVRRARKGEKITTLDGEAKELSDRMLVIADAKEPVAVAGVMGGERSGVSEKTTNLLLESAWFDPVSIRKTSKALGMHTDASHRFERGADFDEPAEAVDAVAALILELAGGKLVSGLVDSTFPAAAPKPKAILLRRSRIDRIAGSPIPGETVAPLFARLGIPCEPHPEGWSITVPTRRVDLDIEDDLVEEVLRHHGYDRVPTVPPAWPPSEGALSLAKRRENALRDGLLAAGLDEVVTYSFLSQGEARAVEGEEGVSAAPEIENPLAETQGILRTNLLATLLPAAAHNVRHGQKEVALFEIGRGFRILPDRKSHEELRLAGFVIGGRWPHDWHGRKGPEFADAKGVVETLLERLGVAEGLSWRPAEETPLNRTVFAPGRAAEVLLGGRVVARLGELAPAVLHGYELGGTWVGGELLLGRVLAGGPGSGSGEEDFLPAPPDAFAFRSFSRFPSIELDLTMEHDLRHDLASILAFLKGLPEPAASLLESAALKDRFDGKGVPAGRVRTTLSFVYRRGDRSLTQEEVRPVHEEVVARLLETFEATRS